MSNQRTQDFQSQQLQKNRTRPSGLPMTRETQLQVQAKQQKSELEANEKLVRLAQEQQRKHQEHPAKNPQQAAAQQKADNKQLTLLAEKNYREVFLPGQVLNALEAQKLSPSAQRSLQNLNKNLEDDAWWSKQEGAQLTGKIKAYSDTLTALTTGLLGFDLASPPATPAPLSGSSIDGVLTKDAFNQNAATQLIQQAALTERLMAFEQLAVAVKDFNTLSTAAASGPALPSDPKKLRKEVQKSLRTVNKEMGRYYVRIVSSDRIYNADKALRKSTSEYLTKNGK